MKRALLPKRVPQKKQPQFKSSTPKVRRKSAEKTPPRVLPPKRKIVLLPKRRVPKVRMHTTTLLDGYVASVRALCQMKKVTEVEHQGTDFFFMAPFVEDLGEPVSVRVRMSHQWGLSINADIIRGHGANPEILAHSYYVINVEDGEETSGVVINHHRSIGPLLLRCKDAFKKYGIDAPVVGVIWSDESRRMIRANPPFFLFEEAYEKLVHYPYSQVA